MNGQRSGTPVLDHQTRHRVEMRFVAGDGEDIGIEQKIAHAALWSFQRARTRRRVSGVSDFKKFSSAAPLRSPCLMPFFTLGVLLTAADLAPTPYSNRPSSLNLRGHFT